MAETKTTFENLPDDKRQRVLDAATVEFAEHGYHQASVNRIVGSLGIAKGSLFKYFGNKQGLFEYLFGNAVEQFKKPLKSIRDAADDNDFFLRLEKLLLAGIDFIESHPLIYRIYLKMLYQENFPLRETFLAQVRQESTEFLGSLVEQAIRSGQLRPDIDPAMAVYLLDSVMDRFFQAYAVPFLDGGTGLHKADRETMKTKARAVADFLRNGLAAHPDTRE